MLLQGMWSQCFIGQPLQFCVSSTPGHLVSYFAFQIWDNLQNILDFGLVKRLILNLQYRLDFDLVKKNNN